MLRRTANAAFAAGMYVFPGGRVDDVDHAADARAVLRRPRRRHRVGPPRHRPRRPRLLGRRRAGVLRGGRRAARPPRATAARSVVDDADRKAVHAGELSMEELCRRDDLVLDLSAIRYVAHWVTPVGEGPRRFDTRFFLAAAPARPGGRARRRRVVDSMWVRPADAVAQAEAGELLMMPPTIANLRFVAECADGRRGARPSPTPSARRRGSCPKLRRDDAGKVVGEVACPATPTTTTPRTEPARRVRRGRPRRRASRRAEQPAMSVDVRLGRRRPATHRRRARSAIAPERRRRAGAAAVVERDRAARRRRRRRRPARAAPGRAAGTPISSASAAPPPAPNSGYVVAVLAREVGHVLDHADDAHEAAPGHVGGPLGDLLGGQRRRRDDHHVGARQQPGEAHLDVAGAGRHVDQQVVELAPVRRRAGTARRPWSASGPATSAPCPRRRGSRSRRPSAGRRRRAARWG